MRSDVCVHVLFYEFVHCNSLDSDNVLLYFAVWLCCCMLLVAFNLLLLVSCVGCCALG